MLSLALLYHHAALFSLPFQKGREKRGVGFSPMPAGIGIPFPAPWRRVPLRLTGAY